MGREPVVDLFGVRVNAVDFADSVDFRNWAVSSAMSWPSR